MKSGCILGIDPGLASLGWGAVRSDGTRVFYLGHGCITTKSSDDTCLRIGQIRNKLAEILKTYNPDALAVEGLYFSKNVTSALYVAEVRGVIKLLAFDHAIPMYEYTPLIIKQAVCGSGRAEKSEVSKFVKLILGLDAIPEPDHASDALAAAICCSNSSQVASGQRGIV